MNAMRANERSVTCLVNSAALGYGGREESQAREAGWEIKSGNCCSRTPKAVASRPQSKGGSFAAALERRVYINPTRWFEGAPANVWEEKQQRIGLLGLLSERRSVRTPAADRLAEANMTHKRTASIFVSSRTVFTIL